jgi:hypothetical protein
VVERWAPLRFVMRAHANEAGRRREGEDRPAARPRAAARSRAPCWTTGNGAPPHA